MEKETITIQGHPFLVATIYDEGHECTAGEASQLNQVRFENLRNNFAAKVKAAIDAANGQSVDLSGLQTQFDDYAASYAMGVRTGGGGGTRDPVMSEAMSIARGKIKDALKKKGRNLKDVEASAITDAAKRLIADPAKGPAILELARTRVAEAQAVASEDLSALVDDLPAKAAEQPAQSQV